MIKKQRLIVIALAVADLLVLLLLCGTIVSGLSSPARVQATQLPTSSPTNTPEPTPIPTWTPTPTPTPYVPPTPTLRPLKDEEAAMLNRVEQEVAVLRGLAPLRSVPRWKITRVQLRRRYGDTLISDEWEEAARSLTLVLAAFDFMSPDTDLLDLWRDGFSEGVAGFYMVETEEIYVVSDAYAIGAVERAIFAHEFGHALQDQYFDLETLGLDVTSGPEYADHLLAVDGLIEGDAELIQEQYIEGYFSEADVLELLNESLKYTFSWSDVGPRVLGEISIFPYTYGRRFVGELHERGGWQAVNDAYADPPVSTEQILHPERYLAGDQPVLVSLPPLTDTLGNGWRLVYDGTAGEFLLGLYLENRLSAEEAAVAVEGWGGDRCTVYYHDAAGKTVLLLSVVWDTPADAEEFLDTYVSYADARFGHSADQITGGLACWQGRGALCVTWEGDSVTVALGPDQATVDGVLAVSLPE